MDSSSPRYGEKASYYSAVCLETGAVEWMELEGNSNAGTLETFLRQLRERRLGPLNLILGKRAGAPGRGRQGISADAWAGAAVGEPPVFTGAGSAGYSPDFNADEAVWGWAGEEATGNLCLGTRALVQDRANNFLSGLASRRDEVKRRCRTVLQSRAERLPRNLRPDSPRPENTHPPLALV